MKQYFKLILTLIFTIILSNVIAQNNNGKIDTIDIYKNKTGVGFKHYMKTWFWSYGLLNKSSIRIDKMNNQDSSVLSAKTGNTDFPKHFRIFDSKNRIIFEGTTAEDGEMVGFIKYYYKSGQLKRVEQLGTIELFDGINEIGDWKYYCKDGTLKKERKYITYKYFKTTRHNNKKNSP